MRTGTDAAHKLLEYLITKAVVSRKLSTSHINLNFNELCSLIGEEPYEETDIDLRIDFALSWVEPEDLELAPVLEYGDEDRDS